MSEQETRKVWNLVEETKQANYRVIVQFDNYLIYLELKMKYN